MDRINLNSKEREPVQGHTSKGDQPKWQANGKWFKADHMGYEALAEVVVSTLLAKSNVEDYVVYEPIWIEHDGMESAGCVSKNFKAKDEMLIPFERLHRSYKGRGLSEVLGKITEVEDRIRYTVEFVEAVTGLKNVGAWLTMQMELDGFFLNEDRHTNNLAVLRDIKTSQFRLCPVFDNGLALLSDTNDYPVGEDVYSCIPRVQAKPFDRDFDIQVEACEALYGMPLRFSFNKEDVDFILQELMEIYGKQIIERVRRIIFEQMRKYTVYWV